MKTPPQHFSTRRLGAWQNEWEFLQRSLAHEPEAVQAWWWKIRLRVLAFVIARYGVAPAVRARDHAPAPCDTSADMMFGKRHTIEPRPCNALGAHLQSIAKANGFSRPTPPDEYRSMPWTEIEVGFTATVIVMTILGGILCWVGFYTAPKWGIPLMNLVSRLFTLEQ